MGKTKQHPIDKSSLDVGSPVKLTLFNDDWHTFDQVIMQLVKALNCNTNKAYLLTTMVHLEGKAIVFKGELEQCLQVSMILQEIDLGTSIVL